VRQAAPDSADLVSQSSEHIHLLELPFEAIVNALAVPFPAAVERAYFQRSSNLRLPRKCLLLRRLPNPRQLTGPAKRRDAVN
jgi:hypothetical protein